MYVLPSLPLSAKQPFFFFLPCLSVPFKAVKTQPVGLGKWLSTYNCFLLCNHEALIRLYNTHVKNKVSMATIAFNSSTEVKDRQILRTHYAVSWSRSIQVHKRPSIKVAGETYGTVSPCSTTDGNPPTPHYRTSVQCRFWVSFITTRFLIQTHIWLDIYYNYGIVQ